MALAPLFYIFGPFSTLSHPMSVIFCLAGQCGNQLGYSVLDSLHRHLAGPAEEGGQASQHIESFFRESSASSTPSLARAVCIDTEPKVVNECLLKSRRQGKWTYAQANMLYRHGGAGNNWAMGYQMCSGDFLEASLNSLRRELEHCDQPPLILTVHSVAGGTGSGLGTHITEATRDEFPDVVRMNVAVTPYHFGEVVVQHYNAVLSLAKISSSSHAVLTFENEVAQELCKKMRRIERPTIDDINQTITSNLVPILLPKYSAQQRGSVASHLHDDIVSLCSHPSYRFLDVKSTPQTSAKSVEFTFDSWNSLLLTLEKMHDRGTALDARLGGGGISGKDGESIVRSVACLVTMRGVDAKDQARSAGSDSVAFARSASTSTTRFFSRRNFSLLLDDAVQVHHSAHIVNGYQRSASLLSNGQAILPILQRAATKAAELFRVGAYLHQYSSCGLEGEDFVASFRSIGQTIENYQSLSL